MTLCVASSPPPPHRLCGPANSSTGFYSQRGPLVRRRGIGRMQRPVPPSGADICATRSRNRRAGRRVGARVHAVRYGVRPQPVREPTVSASRTLPRPPPCAASDLLSATSLLRYVYTYRSKLARLGHIRSSTDHFHLMI